MWQLICGNGWNGRKKKWQLIFGNVVAGMEGKKKKKNSANGVAENERENCLDKKKNLDSYSKKYTYYYSFHVSVVFLTEAVWFMCMWCSFISYSKSIFCMICPMKQIMNLDSKYIDSYSQKKKKVHRFLQNEMKEKNDLCAL